MILRTMGQFTSTARLCHSGLFARVKGSVGRQGRANERLTLRRLSRNDHGEERTAGGGAFRCDGAAVGFDEGFDEAQAEAEAALRAAFVAAIEAFPDAGQVVGVDA